METGSGDPFVNRIVYSSDDDFDYGEVISDGECAYEEGGASKNQLSPLECYMREDTYENMLEEERNGSLSREGGEGTEDFDSHNPDCTYGSGPESSNEGGNETGYTLESADFGHPVDGYDFGTGGVTLRDEWDEDENRKRKFEMAMKARDLRNLHVFESWGLVGIVFLIYATTIVLLLMGRVSWLPVPETSFWGYLCVFFCVFFVFAMTGGWLVVHQYIDVMWSRKNIHVQSFVLPFTLYYAFSFEKNITTYLLTILSAFLAYVPLVGPIRENEYTRIFAYAYSSFNRPEDRPFTLVYAITQNMATFAVMIPLGYLIGHVLGHPEFLNIPIMTVAFGDGSAELVGRTLSSWGLTHNYMTNAMWSEKRFKRSVEGNMCVYFAALISILVVTLVTDPGTWNTEQISVGCTLIPVLAAVVEAKAPHSWDNALLLSSVGMVVFAIFMMNDNAIVGFSRDSNPDSGMMDNDDFFSVGLVEVGI